MNIVSDFTGKPGKEMIRFSNTSAYKGQHAALYKWAHANPPEPKGIIYLFLA
jgi:hypothetical protein